LLARSPGTATSYSFGDISGSNIAIGNNINQIAKKEDAETQKLLQELKVALESRDKNKVLNVLGYLGDKSLDLLIAIIAGGVRQ
jgi:hypothetical protein